MKLSRDDRQFIAEFLQRFNDVQSAILALAEGIDSAARDLGYDGTADELAHWKDVDADTAEALRAVAADHETALSDDGDEDEDPDEDEDE